MKYAVRYPSIVRGASFALTLAAIFFITSNSSHAQTFTVLRYFAGGPSGDSPVGGLVRDAAGNLYGTTFLGGNSACDCGTVFKLDPTGNKKVLHRFAGGKDGSNPEASLLLDAAGNLYGEAGEVVFKIAPSGHYSVLHRFEPGVGADGGLVQDGVGNLYGTTDPGGSFGHGSVFRITPSGQETDIYSFTGGADGDSPRTGLVAGSGGNFYGGTLQGGTSGLGTVYKLTKQGVLTVLYNFVPGDGQLSLQTFVRDSSGNLYGMTTGGGTGPCSGGCGSVFKIANGGAESVVYSFQGPPDGAFPIAGLSIDSSRTLYGTTVGGGTSGGLCIANGIPGCGTIFKLDRNGSETVLYSFDGSALPRLPFSGVIFDSDGNLYGTTLLGGKNDNGSIFELTP